MKLLIKLQKSRDIIESETENIAFDGGKPKERYISQEKRQRIIDKLRLI